MYKKNFEKVLVFGVAFLFFGMNTLPVTQRDGEEKGTQPVWGADSGIETKGDLYEEIVMRYTFERPTVETIEVNGSIYDRVLLPDAPCIGTTGEPSLPSKGAYILLPLGTSVKSIEVIAGEQQSLGLGFTVEPVAQPVPLSQFNGCEPLIPNEGVYGSSKMYPGELFTQIGTYGWKGYQIVVGSLHPVQYLPTTGELSYYSEITVVVHTIKDSLVNTLFRGSPTDESIVRARVDNPDIITSYEMRNTQPYPEKYDMLLITTDLLRDGFKPLADAHGASGVNTMIITLEEIGANTPEDIREYIKEAYRTWGITYVLLGGDEDVVPAKTLYFGNYNYDDFYGPSDLYYACLDGPYNYDGDNKWGEDHDGQDGGDVDLMAEVYVGRSCVGNLTEVGHFVNKTLTYMKRDGSEEYLSKALMVGERMTWDPYDPVTYGCDFMDELANGSTAGGYETIGIPDDECSMYNVSRLYDRDWPGHNWPASELINRINSGVHIINHLGHSGNYYNMKLNLITHDLDQLTNNEHCFIYSAGCDAGAFDEDAYGTTDCIAEHFTIKSEYGAFAGIWNARYGFASISQHFHRQFWDAVFGENITVISKANQDSKEDNLYSITLDVVRWCYYELNLFGDPAIAFKLLNPKHNIAVSALDVPDHIPFDITTGGNTNHIQSHKMVYINTTIVNSGQQTETNVTVRFLIDGSLITSQVIPVFRNHTVEHLSILWALRSPGIHRVIVGVTIPGGKEEMSWDNKKIQTIIVGVQNIDTSECFGTIQQAINDPETLNGHHILVPHGVYREHIVVSKNISLMGMDRETTIIDGTGSASPVIKIYRQGQVNITGFTLKNGSYGIFIISSSNTSIRNTSISGNAEAGISIIGYSRRNVIVENDIQDNPLGLSIAAGGVLNLIYHNNFNNTENAYDNGGYNQWNSSYYAHFRPCGGNWWSDYNGSDYFRGSYQNRSGSDGIGDIPYNIPGFGNQDRYPLMKPYTHPLSLMIYVDDDNIHGPWDGTPDHPYRHIQDAVTIASDSDTIFVYNGTYQEKIAISKSINLLGQDKNSTILNRDESWDFVITVTAENVNISGFTIQSLSSHYGSEGIHVIFNRVTIAGNIIKNFMYGIYLDHCSYGTVRDNIITENTEGIGFTAATYHRIMNNTICDNGIRGILVGVGTLYPCNNNRIEGNVLMNNNEAIEVCYSSSYNTIVNNTIAGGRDGIVFHRWSSNNIISENTIRDNSRYGILLYLSANNNTFSHNNLINNTIQASDSCHNRWNESYPSGGNYWDNYTGVDDFSGPNQDQVGPDGIGDTPYALSGGTVMDYYPLMSVFGVLHADAHGPYAGLVDESIQFFGTAAGGTHLYTWLWEFGDNLSSDEKNPTHTYHAVGIYPVTFTVTDSEGNLSMNTTTALVQFLFADTQGPYYGFAGEPVQFTGSVHGLFPPYTWFWEFGDPDHHTSENQTPTFVYNISGRYLVTLTMTDSQGHTDTDSTNVSIHTDYFWVDDDFNESTPGWGFDRFNTIQAGVDQTDDGDQVYVFAGTYVEHVIVETRITLQGENLTTTSINGSGSGTVVWILASQMNMSGFTIRHGVTGILVEGSSNTISGNRIIEMNGKGIELSWDQKNKVVDNMISSNFCGILLNNSDQNTISGNMITQNTYGMRLDRFSCENTITGNTIDESTQNGIKCTRSYDNTIVGNNITNTASCGILLDSQSDNCIIYHNNFINNSQQAYAESTSRWDDYYPAAGNYWDDYNGSDFFSGSGQNLSGSDGIGDTPYLIPSGSNTDRYPLMQPWNGTPPVPLPDIVYIDDDFNESTPGWCLDHFNNIQEGINTVKTGGIVFVFNGTYSSITIFKSLALMGENNKTTIIDGGYHSSEVVLISADHVTMSSFTIQHGGGQDSGIGIAIRSDYVTIMDNIITNNSTRGVALSDASHTLITRNVITNCPGYGGIQLHGSSTNITITENCISNNDYGIWICCASGTIFFYHNNFLNNTVQAEDDSSYSDIHYWDNGYPSGGNYWSDYNGSDNYSGPGQNESGSDGIGDTPYHILHYGSPYSHDYYPFIAPDEWVSIP